MKMPVLTAGAHRVFSLCDVYYTLYHYVTCAVLVMCMIRRICEPKKQNIWCLIIRASQVSL